MDTKKRIEQLRQQVYEAKRTGDLDYAQELQQEINRLETCTT